MNEKIWKDQKSFNVQFFKDLKLDLDKLSAKEKIHWSKEFFFHISKELTDLVNCLPHWKMHYRNDEQDAELIPSNMIEEYIDVLKYIMGLGQVLGISYDDIVVGYTEKTEVVKQRYQQNIEFKRLSGKKVVVFDIDGVINDYPDCFLDWVFRKKRKSFSTLEKLKSTYDIKTYEKLKTEYRLSGEKRIQPINRETLQLMQTLKQKGEKIILFTNRPVSKYKVINSDTLCWLKTNKIPFDAIYWSDYEKKEDINKLKFDIKFIVEDNLDNAKNFNHEGHLVYLLDKDYNRDKTYKHKKLIRIKYPLEILKHE
jgi:hypothetical protein